MKEWNEMDAGKYFSEEKDLEKIAVLSNGFRNINAVREKDPQLALTLFFDLKNRFFDQFSETDSPRADFLKAYEEKIRLKPIEFLPSVPLRNSRSMQASIHFLFQLTFGIATYFSLRTRNEIRTFVWVVGANGGLLALTGIIQKLTYLPADNLNEIFGLWDTPEPRYFYSSFTYKNHCALLLSFRCSPFLLCFTINSSIPRKKLFTARAFFF